MYRNSKYELYSYLIVFIIFAFRFWPWQTFLVLLTVGFIYYYFRYLSPDSLDIAQRGAAKRRKEALQRAKIYLGHYSDIWRNLRLSNRHCYLNLSSDGITITGFEKDSEGNYLRTFTVLSSRVHPPQEVWNMFCKVFRYNTSYDGLKEHCRKFELVIEESIAESPIKIPETKSEQDAVKKEAELIDINNASEKDLKDLPGISAIMAKKAIKRREDIGGFKTIEEFFEYLRIKPNMQQNLLPLITLKKMQGYKKVNKYQERNIDL